VDCGLRIVDCGSEIEERDVMMRRIVIGAALLVAVGCGGGSEKSEQSSNAGSASSTASQSEQTPQTAQQSVDQMMKGLEEMQKGQGKVVDYTELKALIPELSGWKRREPKGETVTMGMSMSRAEADYEKGDQSMSLEILDTNFAQALVMPFTFAASMSQRSDDGYKQAFKVGSSPGWEDWQKDGHGEIHLLVGNRFVVTTKGNGLPNSEPLKQLAQAVDLSKLASLK
jgi:hypothetical protein